MSDEKDYLSDSFAATDLIVSQVLGVFLINKKRPVVRQNYCKRPVTRGSKFRSFKSTLSACRPIVRC